MERVHYINAGAGAGKTTTLVSELKKILTATDNNGKHLCQPSEIILTTYTKAAAKEFREKTFKKLLEKQNGQPAPIDVAKILDTATIGTVHSVAEQYLLRYWSLLGYSGQFNVMSETDKEIYINRSLRELVDEQDILFFSDYAELFQVRNRKNKIEYNFWKSYVLDIVSKMRSYNIAIADLKKHCKKSCVVVKRLFTSQLDKFAFAAKARKYHQYLDDRTHGVRGKKQPSAEATKATNKLSLYDDFITTPKPSQSEINLFLLSDFFKGTISKDRIDQKEVEHSRDSVKKYLNALLFFSPDNGKRVQDCIKRIFSIAEKWFNTFEQYKRDNNLLDFDDLEAKFLKLLDEKAVKEDIHNSVKYLFVDEFQDSNPIQLEIFQKLSDLMQVKSYWVGDPKQAIYGFRGSDSSLTTKLLDSFPKPERKQDDKNFQFTENTEKCSAQLIDTSWRSTKSLVQLSNEVFSKSFKKGVKTERIKNVPLKYIRKDRKIKHPIQHWHCDSYDALATRVAEILNGKNSNIPGVYEEENPWNWRRKIVPSDIAILTFDNDDCAKIATALRKKNIPVALAETDIRDKAEVKLVLALLKYVAHKNRKFAKAELAKLWEDKTLETILKEIAKGRYNYNPYENTTASQNPVPKDPDKFFAMLDDKLNGLRGLNISAIVKGIIAVLDLRNMVAKWNLAEIRRENLDMLIAQATAFELSTAHTTGSATVTDFIDYINKVKIEAQLDQSAEGVKVATYHKSKGLQWKIVILDSLTKDDLDPQKFVRYNWFGLNLKGGYNAAELQFIPPIGTIDDEKAGIVEKLRYKKRDNGYYNLKHGKVEGEIKRLLYVGVTRARDYLITISTDAKPLMWVQNVRQDSLPSRMGILEDIANQTDGSMIDIWGISKHLALYEKLSDDPTITYKKTSAKATKLKPFATSTETIHKTISPSSSTAQYDATPSLVKDFTSHYIDHNSIKDSAAFGTCIHNYMAAHRWEGTDKKKDNESANIDLAKQTVKNHNMQDVLPKPELLTQAADALFAYLENTFGPAKELLRECPFTYCRDNGQIVSGEIDLVWKTDKDCILLDHKNFPAIGVGKNMVLDKNNDHYVGKYFSQLGDYRAALNADGMNVTNVFIFYAVLGCLVEVEF